MDCLYGFYNGAMVCDGNIGIEEGVGGEACEGFASEGLETCDAAVGAAVDYDDALPMLREHREKSAENIVEVVDTIEVEVVATGGKRTTAAVGVTVEHEDEIE